MTANSIPDPLRDLLSKLVFLSMIEKGRKPCMHDMTFVKSSSWMGSLRRAVAGEGRKSMIIHINQIVDTAIQAIEEYRDTEFLSLIVNKLAMSKIGIENLITTYQKHPDTIAKIRICVDNINIQLEKNKQFLQGHNTLSARVPPPPPPLETKKNNDRDRDQRSH
jgi:hypothetical protein